MVLCMCECLKSCGYCLAFIDWGKGNIFSCFCLLCLFISLWWLCAWCRSFCVKSFDCELCVLAFVCYVCLRLCGRLCVWCRAFCISIWLWISFVAFVCNVIHVFMYIRISLWIMVSCICLLNVCLRLCGRLCAWCRSCTTSVLSSRLYWNPIPERGGSPKIGSF